MQSPQRMIRVLVCKEKPMICECCTVHSSHFFVNIHLQVVYSNLLQRGGRWGLAPARSAKQSLVSGCLMLIKQPLNYALRNLNIHHPSPDF